MLSTEKCYDQSYGYVTGGIIEQLSGGVSIFSSLLAYCDPGFDMPVFVSATIEGISMQTSFVLSFRECVRGEYFADSICIPCPRGTFSVTDPSTSTLSELSQQMVCLECLHGATDRYKDTVVLHQGYLRISELSATPINCPRERSCSGGAHTGDMSCSDGYEGTSLDVAAVLHRKLLFILSTWCRPRLCYLL